MQKTTNDIALFLIISTFLIFIMGGFILSILFLYRKKQNIHIKEIEEIRSDYEKSILKTQLEIQEQTFKTISREIHDNINLSLTLAKLNMNTINLADKTKSLLLVSNTIELVSKAISDLTDISRNMNSDIITEYGLITALHREVDKINDLDWFKTKLAIEGNPVFMDAQTELFIYRITQEAFNNILKHAEAKNVRLNLCFRNELLTIEISDDGIGFNNLHYDPDKKITSGLINMKKRTELINGKFELHSNPGSGTKIFIKIPINT